jgi:hypothetical protein
VVFGGKGVTLVVISIAFVHVEYIFDGWVFICLNSFYFALDLEENAGRKETQIKRAKKDKMV